MAEKRRYKIHLDNGKKLVLEGDRPPTNQEIWDAAVEAGVEHRLVKREKPAETPASSAERSPLLSIGAGAAVSGVMKSAPSILKGINLAANKAAQIGRGAGPGLPSLAATGYVLEPLTRGDIETPVKRGAGVGATYAAGKAVQRAAGKLAEVTRALPGESIENPLLREMVRRSSPAAKVASKVAAVSRAAGPVGLGVTLATLPAHGPTKDTPDGERIRMRVYREVADDINKAAGREVITGSTSDELEAAIRKYRGMQPVERTPPSEGMLREMVNRLRGVERG